MSENIQSISQGTYTIGQTSATNFQAGPGISITQPSEGTVRIANDETVLWEDTNYTYGRTSVTLSESYKNFERIRIISNKGDSIEFTPANYAQYNHQSLFHLGNAFMMVCHWDFTDDTTYAGTAGNMVDLSNMTSFTINASSQYGRWTQPVKIIGINRISGSNA